MRALAVVSMLLLAGCAGSDAPLDDEPVQDRVLGDPLAVGGLASELIPFDLGQQVVEGGGEARYLVHIHGETTLPEGDGPFPVVIFMHGRHGTCATPLGERLLQPCPDTPATASVESYTGYRYLAEHLAGHGIAVVSVDANNVNDHDNDWAIGGGDYGATARANIILQVLDGFDAAEFDGVGDKLDTNWLGLMGHSRGGEGVIRAASMIHEDGSTDLRAVFALAPTYFRDWGLTDNMAFGTILPYCDGDVYSLHGVGAFADARRPRHQFLHMGANHNYYNTVWTRDDAGWADDPYCDAEAPDSGRLDPETQRTEGTAIMGAFFRHYLNLEHELRPFLTGEEPLPGDVRTMSDLTSQWGLALDGGHNNPGQAPLLHNVTLTDCAYSSCADVDAFIAGATRVKWENGGSIDVGTWPQAGKMLVVTHAAEDPAVLDQVRLEWKDGPSMTLREAGAQALPGEDWRKLVLADTIVPIPDAGRLRITMDGSGEIIMTSLVQFEA